MEDVQPFCLVSAEEGGDDGIDEGFHRAIAEAEHDRARIEQIPRRGSRGGEGVAFKSCARRMENGIGLESQHRVDRVADKTEDHRRPVANAVDDETEKDDRNGERPDARAEEFLGLDCVQAKIGGPEGRVVDKKRPRDEGERGGNEGDEATPEELLVFIGV